MNMKKIFTSLALIFCLIGNALHAQKKAGPNAITFKKDIFEQNLTTAIAPTTVGYQFVLIKDGKIVSERFGGDARRGNDGNLKMTATTPINIGSLFKFISGTALLNLMEKSSEKMGSNYKNVGFDTRIDKPIWGEFPKVWLDVIPKPGVPGPTQRSITFRQLLQHRSGFDDDWNIGQKGGRPFLPYLQNGFLAADYDKREYANMNFVTVGHLIPLVERHNFNYDLDLETNGMSQAAADEYVRKQTGLKMDSLMRERIWSKMSPAFNPSCDAPNKMKNTAAYGYRSPTDNAGVISSAIETKGYCGGEGGYYMSARDFANYIAHFGSTDLIVSKTVRDKMFNDEIGNDYMVWAAASNDNWMNQNFDMPRIAWSNGGTDGTRTVLMRLPNNYYLIVFSNTRDDSQGWSPGQLYNFGLAAFKAGMQHNF